MRIRLRCLLAMLAVLALAVAMTDGWGFFTPVAFGCGLAALLLSLAACTGPDWEWQAPTWVGWAIPAGLLAPLALFLSGFGALHAEVLSQVDYPETVNARVVKYLPLIAGAGLVILASLLIHRKALVERWRGLFLGQVGLLFLAGAGLRVTAVLAVPDPSIDVYSALQEAPRFLLHGKNPYTADYSDSWPYADPPQEYDAPPFYPPLPILLALPFRAAGVDIRYANVLCDLLAALVLLATGWSRGRPLVGALAMGTYLFFPRMPFMMEQSWYEPMLAATLGGGLWLVERRYRFGNILLGLGLTGKQYGVVLLPPLVVALRKHWRALLLGIVLACLCVLLPFFLWDPHAFLDVVVFKQLQRPIRDDSLTLQSGAINLAGYQLSQGLLWGVALLLIGWISWRAREPGTGAALWLGTTLLAFCFCHSQGYFNYFYLCQYLWLLGIAGLGRCPHAPLAFVSSSLFSPFMRT
ncbi:MAG: DUF2029 domain-containing protein [Planctomycetes bacterium]|nr:DUF2029 domain-containing protein [Planctomycetota bacterium]